MKEWAVIHRVKELVEEGLSLAEIAKREGIDRKTARKYRDWSVEEIKEMRGRACRRSSKIENFKKWLKDRVGEYEEEGVVNCESLYRELIELGYKGSVRTVRRFVSKIRTKKAGRIYEPFETGIGYQAMVDLGESRRVRLGGGIGVMYFALMALSWSRKKYGMWWNRPITTEMFLGFHRGAFESFGGVPGEVVYDQTKLAVLKERYGECEFNEDFYAFARFYRYKPYICNGYDPQSKGKIESVKRYAKRGFLPGRSFVDVRDVQIQWEDWVENVADVKLHETTGKSPKEMWMEERTQLKPLPEGGYQAQSSMEKRKVLANGLVKVLGNAYSVPAAYHGKEVLVHITEERIEFCNVEREPIWTHWRGEGKGRRFIQKSHYEREHSVPTEELEKELMVVYGTNRMLDSLRSRFPRHYREQLRGLIRLGRDYATHELQAAAERALFFGCVSFGNIEKILRSVADSKPCRPLVKASLEKGVYVLSSESRTMDYYTEAVSKLQEEQNDVK